MCAVTLSILPACGHELPTIDYCEKMDGPVASYKAILLTGEMLPPPPTCTFSLGGILYRAFDGVVTCEDCKAWLTSKGKRTFGGAGLAPRLKLPKGGASEIDKAAATAAEAAAEGVRRRKRRYDNSKPMTDAMLEALSKMAKKSSS